MVLTSLLDLGPNPVFGDRATANVPRQSIDEGELPRMRQRTRRIRRAEIHARRLLAERSTSPSGDELRAILRGRLRAGIVVHETPDALVTECGFVTMAILPAHAVRVGEAIVTPGVDDRGQRGFLVTRDDASPFHSLAPSAALAAIEAAKARRRALALVEAFGGREALRTAAREAPWHLLSVFADTERAGLCAWGSVSFLRRFRLQRLAKSVGVPRCLLRLGGPYGDRVTAATLLRRGLADGASCAPIAIAEPAASATASTLAAFSPSSERDPVPTDVAHGRPVPDVAVTGAVETVERAPH